MTSIFKDEATGEFEVTANHWEPQSYVDHMQQQGQGGSSKNKGTNNNSIQKFYASFSMATAATLVLTRLVLKESRVLALYPGLQEVLGHSRPWDVVVTLTLIVLLTTALMLMKTSDGGSGGAEEHVGGSSSEPVGEGGELVTVEEMKVGGSGSSTVMNGKSVATEQIRCRYVVNAAGCNSDKIAKMIGYR